MKPNIQIRKGCGGDRTNEERMLAWQNRKNARLLMPKARFSLSIWKPV